MAGLQRLYAWKHLPDASGAKPDFVFRLPERPWDAAAGGGGLALAGRRTVYAWKRFGILGDHAPGRGPERVLQRRAQDDDAA